MMIMTPIPASSALMEQVEIVLMMMDRRQPDSRVPPAMIGRRIWQPQPRRVGEPHVTSLATLMMMDVQRGVDQWLMMKIWMRMDLLTSAATETISCRCLMQWPGVIVGQPSRRPLVRLALHLLRIGGREMKAVDPGRRTP